MTRLIVCVAIACALFTALPGQNATEKESPLEALHSERCQLLTQRLEAICVMHANGRASKQALDEATVQLLLAEVEATSDAKTRSEKQDAAIKVLETMVEQSHQVVAQGMTSVSKYRDAQLRLIETKIAFLSED